MNPKKDPFALCLFDRAEDARAALLELPCIHQAQDTGNLICSETLVFGYWSDESGGYHAIICGDDLSYPLWQQAKDAFERHAGRLKSDLAPNRDSLQAKSGPEGRPQEVAFVRERREEKMGSTFVYRIYKGPNSASAKSFLEKTPVAEKFFYIVVETPEGNYCRDIKGIYKE